MKTKIETLAEYLDCEVDDLTEATYQDDCYELGDKEYLVLTDAEANVNALEHIKDSLWAFNAYFLAGYCELPIEVFKALQPQCESANDAILALIERTPDGSVEDFADDAISADGRGHFISSYDGDEIEAGEFFIYRIN